MPVGLRAESVASAALPNFPGSESRGGGGGKSPPVQPQGFNDVVSEWQLGQTMGSPLLTDTSLGNSWQAGKFKILLGAIKKNNGRVGQRRAAVRRSLLAGSACGLRTTNNRRPTTAPGYRFTASLMIFFWIA